MSCEWRTLTTSERQGWRPISGPKCRGVWLDRGELDKLLEREGNLIGGEPRRRRGNDDDDERNPRRRSMWRGLFD